MKGTLEQSAPDSTPPKAVSVPFDAVQQSLYEVRQKIHPRQVHGLFAALRVAAVLALLGIFYGVPWLQWGERQAVLFDLPARKFYLFGLVLWPQDFLFLTGLLVLAALSLFFFTTLAGRLWCGYACPQTVWTETFLWMERLVEGDRMAQLRLERAPMSLHKARLIATKQTLWVSFSLFTGFSFVGYFTPIRELGHEVATLSLGSWETFWLLFYGFATYGNAGFMREQVCKYMCPYARFQSAMFDANTLIVSYDKARGEPRGSRRAGSDARAQGLGDCINCSMCVQVCPTGIDIRNGLQYECIGCSACIDACDQVMDKVGAPRGLVRYTTQNAIDGKPSRILRPRVYVYASVLLLLMLTMGWGLYTRVPFDVDVMRDRNHLYREVGRGIIENVYTLRLINMSEGRHQYSVDFSGLPGATLLMDIPAIEIPAGEVLDVPVRLRMAEDEIRARSTEVHFIVQSTDDPSIRYVEEGRFLGPAPVHAP
jgi:cytochrome c oxidase accessory protein FixG